MEYHPEINAAVPTEKRPALTGALLLCAIAAGMFVRELFNSIRSLIMIGGGAEGVAYFLTYLVAPVLMFVAALLLALYLAGPYRRGSRPVMVGIAWLLIALTALFTLLGTVIGIPIRFLFRGTRWIPSLLTLALTVLALIAGILTMVGRGWKPLAIVASVTGLALRAAMLALTIASIQNNPGAYLMDGLMSLLPYVLFYLAMLIFTIRYRKDAI